MRITFVVTVEMTPEQMRGWAIRKGIEATEDAIRRDLPGRDIAPLMDGSFGRIVAVDATNATLGL